MIKSPAAAKYAEGREAHMYVKKKIAKSRNRRNFANAAKSRRSRRLYVRKKIREIAKSAKFREFGEIAKSAKFRECGEIAKVAKVVCDGKIIREIAKSAKFAISQNREMFHNFADFAISRNYPILPYKISENREIAKIAKFCSKSMPYSRQGPTFHQDCVFIVP